MRPWLIIAAFCLAPALALAADLPSGAADAEFFEQHVRPLLVRHCHECHGDVAQPGGNLRLDARQAVLKGGDSGPAAVAGKPDESLLVQAVRHDGITMPPEGAPLAAAEVEHLAEWVRRGLPWPELDAQALARARRLAENGAIAEVRSKFWSFQPVAHPPLPEVRDQAWSKTPLDRFILAKLEEHALAPSPPADKRTLLRRLSFDLIGLPPTPAEIDAFLADESPDAVRNVVDRLLASPHYGERWGRHWLDIARFADTKGYVQFEGSDKPWAYTYRDYVVRSFNEDVPYNRFILEQLAADQLDLGEDRRALAGLGFLTVGSGFMNNNQDVIDDRVDVITRGLLGLTVSCARCHDHKFDPIPTADYYALYGVLANCVEPLVPPLFEPPPQTPEYEAFAKELADRQQKLQAFMDQKFADLVGGARTRVSEYLLAAHELRDKPPTEDYMLLADGDDVNPTMIVRYQVMLARAAQKNDPVWTLWHALAAIPPAEFAAQAGPTVERVIREQSAEKPISPLVAGAFLGKPLKEFADVAKIYGELLLGVDKLWNASLEQAKAANEPAPVALADPQLEALRQVFVHKDAPAQLQPHEIITLSLLPDRAAQEAHGKLLKAIEEFRAAGPAAPPRAMVLEDLPHPAQQRIFRRGNPNNLGDPVERRFLRVLSEGEPQPFNQTRSGRLEMARAIADPANPLTARVIVNRVWLEHFGQPLVTTPSDFGLRSEPPSHPALLDWLAWQFMEHNWSLKWLHRQIVLSATYAQASHDRADCLAADPENKWLWKTNRRRLDFETTRDALLAVSGRLDPKLGGPAVKDIATPAATRRTMYGFIDRLNLPGLYRTFDFPNPDSTSPGRDETTVPQQALFFLNHPLVIEAAKHLLEQPAVREAADSDEKIRRLIRLAYGRETVDEELSWARQFTSQAERPTAWQELAQGLLAANEFVFVD